MIALNCQEYAKMYISYILVSIPTPWAACKSSIFHGLAHSGKKTDLGPEGECCKWQCRTMAHFNIWSGHNK